MDALEDLNKLVLHVLAQNQDIKDFLNKIKDEKNIRFLLRNKTISIPVKIITEFITNWTDESEDIKDIKADPTFNQFLLLIFYTITKSPEIRKFFAALSKESFESLMGSDIEIETRVLINSIISNTPSNHKRLIIRREEKPQEPPRERQYIDGIPLTENEETFEEYCAEHFDTKKWLKKNRLIWESKDPKKDKA